MLRYETPPIPSNSTNASVNPAAIFRPNVHMSSLLRNAVVGAASLNRFSDERNTDDRTNHVRRAHNVLDGHGSCGRRYSSHQKNDSRTLRQRQRFEGAMTCGHSVER